jgi:hypothetical protein
VRFGFNRSAAPATDSLANGQNPGIGQTATVNWTDLNGDNVVQYTVRPLPNGGVVGCVYRDPGCEIDFSSLPVNFGAGAINNQLNPNLKRPHYSQTNLGFTHEVFPGVSVNFDWFRTAIGDLSYKANLTYVVPGLTDYSKNPNYSPITVWSPIDGHAITVYDFVSSAVRNAASNNFTATDPNHTSVYNGFDIGFNARLPHGARVFGGSTTERTIQNTCSTAIDNPNNLLFCDQSQNGIPWATQIKLSATTPLPWFGLSASASYQGLPGYTLSRSTWTVTSSTRYITCPGNSAAQGCVVGNPVIPGQTATNITSTDSLPVTPATVTGIQLDAPGTTLTPRTNQLDFGLSKRIAVGRLRINPKLDIFNVLNTSDYYTVRSTVFSPILNPNVSDPMHSPALPALAAGTNYTNYLAPSRFIQGRILRLGFNVTW